MANSDGSNAKSGCFPTFLKVLLCATNGKSLPVHPSDQIAGTEHPNKEAMRNDSAKPGVVARLMGLDSLPNTNLAVPDSVPRSRSVNFVDYLLEFDSSQSRHRRVRTSASFREVPALFQHKNNDLVELYWENQRKNHEIEISLRNSDMVFLESEQRNGKKERENVSVRKEKNKGKNKKISKLKNEPRRDPTKHNYNAKIVRQSQAKDLGSVSRRRLENCSCRNGGASSSSSSSSPLLSRQKEKFSEQKPSKKIRKQKSTKIETENCTENLSPVSVLDVDYFPVLGETKFSDDSNSLVSKSKWETSLKVALGDATESKVSNNRSYACQAVDREAENYYSELMVKICSLTEKDLRKTDFTSKIAFGSENFEEICLAFEHKIFDHLLLEFVHELVGI